MIFQFSNELSRSLLTKIQKENEKNRVLRICTEA